MKIFLTGGTGFIGRRLLFHALDSGYQVVALCRGGARTTLFSHPNLTWYECNLSEVPRSAFDGCRALVHLAAHGVTKGLNDWDSCFRTNVIESLQLWKKAAESGVVRFVICGSCFEYGRSGERYSFIPEWAPLEPTGAYHSSKAAASMAALGLAIEMDLQLIILRPFHVYGEGEAAGRFWPDLVIAAKTGADFAMSGGEQIRDFVPVDDVALRFISALEMELLPGVPLVKNIGTGIAKTLKSFAEEHWISLKASGRLIVGAKPYRIGEVMRYVPLISGGEGS